MSSPSPVNTRLLGAIVALLVGTTPPLASAAGQDPQTTDRTSLLAAERDKKASETTPPKRSMVERGLIRAIVATARLSDQDAAQALGDVIIRRRDKVVDFWIRQTNPLDEFNVPPEGARLELVFSNAAVRVGTAQPAGGYRIQWFALDNTTSIERAVGGEIETSDPCVGISEAVWGPTYPAGYRYAIVRIRTLHPRFPEWQHPVTVTLRSRDGSVEIVGIRRAAERRAEGDSDASSR